MCKKFIALMFLIKMHAIILKAEREREGGRRTQIKFLIVLIVRFVSERTGHTGFLGNIGDVLAV